MLILLNWCSMICSILVSINLNFWIGKCIIECVILLGFSLFQLLFNHLSIQQYGKIKTNKATKCELNAISICIQIIWMDEYDSSFFNGSWILQKGRMPTYSRKNRRINTIPIIIDLKLNGCPLLSAMFFTFSKSSLPACHNNNNDFDHLEHFVELKNYLVFNNALNVSLLDTFYVTEFKSHMWLISN